MKASDVFREADFIFARKVSFAEAFPMIETIDIVVRENGDGVPAWRRERFLGKATAGEYVDCSNPLCFDGGVSIGKLVRAMVAAGDSDSHEAYELCQGNEGSPKGRRIYRNCLNSFKLDIHIDYLETCGDEVAEG